MTQRIRKELENEQSHRNKLLQEIQSLKNQLIECQDGLLAAARISDELELSELTNAALKEECKFFFVKISFEFLIFLCRKVNI